MNPGAAMPLQRPLYEVLDPSTRQIRLLWSGAIDHSRGDVLSSLHLATFDLDGPCPPYAALSYTWRSGRDSRRTLIEGREMAVSGNLFLALLAFKKHVLRGIDFCAPPDSSPEHGVSTTRQYLWVDQLCINQSDVDERNHQVQLMGDIYSNAERAIVWLGNECATSLRYPLSQPRGGDHFLWADYWTRVWTAQGFELAKDIWLASGIELVPLSDFDLKACFDSAYWMTARGQSERARKPSWTLSLRMTSRGTIQGRRTRDLMELFRDLESSDPRDTIDGMLGLIRPAVLGWDAEPRHEIKADYTISPVELCKWLLENGVEQWEIPQALAVAAGMLIGSYRPLIRPSSRRL